MQNLDELFSFTAADALAETESKKKSYSSFEGLYKPSIKDEKCQDQNYRALVRFIPFINDGKAKTTVERWECFLKDVNDQNGIFVVSPKTNGKKCPMREMSYKLYTSGNAVDVENSKKINVYQQWYAIVEVVKDGQHPEYEGKHFIYQFGAKIYQKIEAAMKGSEYKDPINPFDFFSARLFEINLTKDNKKMDNGREPMNYDACGFLEKTAPIHFTDAEGNVMTLDTDVESKKAFMEWLENRAPKISNYFFKEWDAETTERVNTNLSTYVSGYTAPKSSVAKAKEILNEMEDENPKTTSKSKTATVKEVVETVDEDDEATEVSADDDAWVDSILNS